MDLEKQIEKVLNNAYTEYSESNNEVAKELTELFRHTLKENRPTDEEIKEIGIEYFPGNSRERGILIVGFKDCRNHYDNL